MRLSDGTNTISDARFEAVLERDAGTPRQRI